MGEKYTQYEGTKLWDLAREEASDLEKDVPLEIFASDIDKDTIEIAVKNAQIAGVGDAVRPKVLDVNDFSSDLKYGTVICNPPYGERLGDEESVHKLYAQMGKTFKKLDKWSYYIMTSNEEFEKHFNKKADKKRKIYNGMLKCNIYQYFGQRPPKITDKRGLEGNL